MDLLVINKIALDVMRQKMDASVMNVLHANDVYAPNKLGYLPQQVIVDAQNFQQVLSKQVATVDAIKAPIAQHYKVMQQPQHPLADAAGYVWQPNVDFTQEMLNIKQSKTAYQANLTAFKFNKNLYQNTLNIGSAP